MKKEPFSPRCSEAILSSEGHSYSNLPNSQLTDENREEECQEKADTTNQTDRRHSEFGLSPETQLAIKNVLDAYPEFAEAAAKFHKGNGDSHAGWIAELQAELAR